MSTPSPYRLKPAHFLSPLKWLLGIGLLAALLAYVHFFIGWKSLGQTLSQLSLSTLLWALLLFSASHLIRALRIHVLLAPCVHSSYWGVAKLSAIHQFANNLLPMRLGEVVLPWLLNKYYQNSWQQGFARLIWLRIFDLSIMGVAGLYLLTMLGHTLLLAAALVGGLVLTTIAILCHRGLMQQATWWQKLLRPLQDTAPNSQKLGFFLLFWTALAWLCKLTALALIVTDVTQLNLIPALAGTLGGELSSILPIHGIAGAGSYEGAFLLGLSLAESPSASLVAVAITVHLFVFITTSLVAILLSPINISPTPPN